MMTDLKKVRISLRAGIAVTALLALSSPAVAEAGLSAVTATAATSVSGVDTRRIEEQQSYALRLMMQVFDGRDDLSHTQMLGIGRTREGNRSFTQFDFGDGAVVINQAGGETAAGRFLNVTGVEQAVLYNYDTKMMEGSSDTVWFHNEHVRPLLGHSPDLGQDARWQTDVPLSILGIKTADDRQARLELSREYFTFDNKPMVLVHYAFPAFRYKDADGRSVIHWGRGFSLTDPGFGMIYINSMLHRAVAQGAENGNTTPYRFSRTMVAANPDGSAMVDYRRVPQLAKYVDAFFSPDALQVVPVDNGVASNLPLDVARYADITALSIAEDGANEAPIASAAQTSANRGVEVGEESLAKALLDAADKTTETPVVKGADALDSGTGILQGAAHYVESNKTVELLETATRDLAIQIAAEASPLKRQLSAAVMEYEMAKKALDEGAKFVPSTTPPGPQDLKTPGLDLLQGRVEAAAADVGKWEGTAESLAAEKAQLIETNQKVPDKLNNDLAKAQSNAAQARLNRDAALSDYSKAYKDQYSKMSVQLDLADPKTKALAARVENSAKNVDALQGELVKLGKQGSKLEEMVRALPVHKLRALLVTLGESPAGKLLTGVGHATNAVTVGKAGYNAYNASSQDLTKGDLKLSRDWDLINQGVDILGLVAGAVTGDVPGVLSDVAAITLGSLSDIYVSRTALLQTWDDVDRRHEEVMANLRRLTDMVEQQEKEKMAELLATPYGLAALTVNEDPYKDGYDLSDPRIDPETGLPKPAYWEYLKNNDPQKLANMGIDPEAPVGGWPNGVGPDARPQDPQLASEKPTQKPVLDLSEDYPKAKPRDDKPQPEKSAKQDVDIPPVNAVPSAEEIIAERKRQAQAELDEYQAELFAQRKLDEAEKASQPRDTEFRISELKVSELVVSGFDLKPVTWDAPEWDPPVWDPPEFELPIFDPPKISEFPPTDPDDLDGYPGTGTYPAFGYENMTGTSPDLARWADWLATQDINRLERMARNAGYPNLAFALADAENIIFDALDPGFRSYANRGPNCAGYTGCTGSVGPWKLAYARVALGDILKESRDVFSTGGLSDIGISGFDLRYVLRDHGVEDGDLINIEISQFGRRIYSLKDHFLLNEGTPFNIRLNQGVAQMVITAVNEGQLPPNTAQITVDNVVRGSGIQSYSLRTHETAVLRIEANAKPE